MFWLSNSDCSAHRCTCRAAAAMTAAGERTSERENGANILAAVAEWGTLAAWRRAAEIPSSKKDGFVRHIRSLHLLGLLLLCDMGCDCVITLFFE